MKIVYIHLSFMYKMGMIITTMSFASQQCFREQGDGVYNEASVVSDCATPWTAAHKAPLSMGFSRQEYWSGLPLPSRSPLS